MNDHTPDNGWDEWRRHVLIELQRAHEERKSIKSELQKTQIEIARLQVKSSIWGGLTGTIVSLAAFIIQALS
ncbi:MAG: hypothetical protein RLP09_02635 [Sandaracinaceae bacterium]